MVGGGPAKEPDSSLLVLIMVFNNAAKCKFTLFAESIYFILNSFSSEWQDPNQDQSKHNSKLQIEK